MKEKKWISGHELQQHLAGWFKKKREKLGKLLTQDPGVILYRQQHVCHTQSQGRLTQPSSAGLTPHPAPFQEPLSSLVQNVPKPKPKDFETPQTGGVFINQKYF